MILRRNIRPNILYIHRAKIMKVQAQQVLHLVAPAPSGSLARFWPEVLPRPIP